MGKVFRLLSSIKLAVVLIAFIAATGMLSTLILQGQTNEFYRSRYPGFMAELLIRSGFTHFFTSILFLVPASLFFVNLSACTIGRFTRELDKKKGRNFGPVLLHFGLMVLVFGAVLSFAARKEGIVYLAKGEQVELPAGLSLSLLDFTFERYVDGRPKDWISTVQISKDGKVEIDSFALRVNSPLKVGTFTLYQSSYGSEEIPRIKDASGIERNLRPGENVESFEVLGFESMDTSGIQAVYDPGYVFVLVALIITGFGIFITLFRKLGEMKS